MIKTYLFLAGAIICEVCGTMLLPVCQNFTKPIPTFFLAVWSGLGIFTIAILGYIFFKQTLSWQAILGLFLIIVGVVLVNSFSSKAI